MANKTINPAGSPKLVQPESKSDADHSAEFVRFERLAKALVTVSKQEMKPESGRSTKGSSL
jgi:hypothetical protein